MDMFYQDEMDVELRFGDVLKGFIFTEPQVNEPLINPDVGKYSIDITIPVFSVVLTPCCSIENNTISLTPLTEIWNSLFRNPYFVEEPTRINRLVSPQQAVPPHAWQKMPGEEREKRLKGGPIYAFGSLFVYRAHLLLPKYLVHTRDGNYETNYYMIDFANLYKLNCDKIKRNTQAPANVKCLQLSVQTRKDLRDKVAHYYGRIPEEDKILLED